MGIRFPRITIARFRGFGSYSSVTRHFSQVGMGRSASGNVPENIGFRDQNAKSWKKLKLGLCKSEILLLYATSLTQRAPLPR